MNQITLSIVIVAIAAILFATEKIPLVLTSLMAMCAMYFTGILTFEQAFSGFTNTAVLVLIGMGIIAQATFATGLGNKLGNTLYRIGGKSEKSFVVALFIISALSGILFNSMAVISLFMPVIDSIAIQSSGRIRRKQCYMTSAMGAVIGANLTVASASSMLNASGIIAASSYGRGMSFFEPAKLALPAVVVCVIVYILFGYRLQVKCFDFEEIPSTLNTTSSNEIKDEKRWKQVFVVVVIVLCIVGFINGSFNMGAVAVLGGCLVLLLKCVDQNTAVRGINWSTILLVASSIGFAKGVDVSGAGRFIANGFIELCGPIGQSPYGMCLVILLLSTFLSNFMSNNAAVSIIVPIALVIAQELGANMMSYAVAAGVGSNIALSTPICTPTITMTTQAGYRFKDYVRIGGLFNVIAFLVSAFALKVVYF